jgi:hypothetical protein
MYCVITLIMTPCNDPGYDYPSLLKVGTSQVGLLSLCVAAETGPLVSCAPGAGPTVESMQGVGSHRQLVGDAQSHTQDNPPSS